MGHMLLRGLAALQCGFYSLHHWMFIVVQNRGQDIGHLSITAQSLEENTLQALKAAGKFTEGRAITQGTGLAG